MKRFLALTTVILLVLGQSYAANSKEETTHHRIEVNSFAQRLLINGIESEDIKLVKLALRKKAQLNYADLYYDHPLKVAIDHNSPGIIKTLINQPDSNLGINQSFPVIETDYSYQITPLIYATSTGNTAMMLELLKLGADPNIQDSEGRTAIYVAAARGDRKAVLSLKNANANYFIQENDLGLNPMHIAIINGHSDVFELLYEIDQRFLYVKDNQNKLPIHFAAQKQNNIGILKSLLQKNKTVIDVKDNVGKAAIHHAASVGNTEAISMLLKAGADIDAKDNKGFNALEHAISASHKDSAELLNQSGLISSSDQQAHRHDDSTIRLASPINRRNAASPTLN